MPLQKVNETRKSQRKTREFLLETKYQEMLHINKEIKGNEQNFLQYEQFPTTIYHIHIQPSRSMYQRKGQVLGTVIISKNYKI